MLGLSALGLGYKAHVDLGLGLGAIKMGYATVGHVIAAKQFQRKFMLIDEPLAHHDLAATDAANAFVLLKLLHSLFRGQRFPLLWDCKVH